MRDRQDGFKKYIGLGVGTHHWNEAWVGTIPFSHWPTLVNINCFNDFDSVSDSLS